MVSVADAQAHLRGILNSVSNNGTGGTGGTGTIKGMPLNDTGIISGGNFPSGNNSTCIGETIAEQDCNQGRDAQAAAGNLIKVGGGDAGFDFTKLDANGQPLANQNQSYVAQPWSCVKDNHTGLIWEVKTPVGSGGIHDISNTYRWGGKTAQIKTGQTWGTRFSDWDTLVDGSNSASLCSFTDWRVPTIAELETVVDMGRVAPAMDTNYFPNIDDIAFILAVASTEVWSASPTSVGVFSDFAWSISHSDGRSGIETRDTSHLVWLVRNGQ